MGSIPTGPPNNLTVPKDTLFEALRLAKRVFHEGMSRKALFAAIVKRTSADRGIPLQSRKPTSQEVFEH